MSDESDSWMQGAFGFNVGAMAQSVVDAVAPAAQAVADAGASAVQTVWNAGETRVEGVWNAGVAGVRGVEAAGAAMVTPPPATEGTFGGAMAASMDREYDLAQSVYTGAAGVYDAVVPNYSKLSRDLDGEVDAGEDFIKRGNAAAVAEFGDVPIIGSAVQGLATVNNTLAEAAGGLVKGVGDLGAMAGNLIVHPVDSVSAVQEGALNLAEHVPVGVGIGTAVKGVHGLVDLARGKSDGKYGGTLSDLGENLRDDTQQDPNDPPRRVNTDVEFAASFGGGRKAWSEKPAEAAVRTLTNLAPMLFGDETMKVPEDMPPTEAGLPEAQRPAFADADTQMPDTQMPDTQMPDTQMPGVEAAPPALDVADLTTRWDRANQASADAMGEWARYQRNAGDLAKWDPDIDAALEKRSDALLIESGKLANDLEAAQKAQGAAPKGRGGTANLDRSTPLDPLADTEAGQPQARGPEAGSQRTPRSQPSSAPDVAELEAAWKQANQESADALGEWAQYHRHSGDLTRWDPDVDAALEKRSDASLIKSGRLANDLEAAQRGSP